MMVNKRTTHLALGLLLVLALFGYAHAGSKAMNHDGMKGSMAESGTTMKSEGMPGSMGGMKQDGMMKDDMKQDGMMKDDMKQDGMMKDDMKHGDMKSDETMSGSGMDDGKMAKPMDSMKKDGM